MPGGYSQVAIPVFKNKTDDVGIESYFTDALILRFARSRVARVGDKESSPVAIEGVLGQVRTIAGAGKVQNETFPLPDQAVITTYYTLTVTAYLKLKRKSDDRVIWEGSFTTEKNYYAPLLGTAVVNSANATYNHSIRQRTLSLIAEEMMLEAHDRMTENF